MTGARSRTHGTRPVVGEWADDAACRGSDPNLFQPTRGANIAVAAALAVCSRCPVVRPCLDHAIEWSEPGIWGGTTARQRYRIRNGHEAYPHPDDDAVA